jgi:hypothetical protein
VAYLIVIPGELAIASATRNPGISKTSGFRGNDGGGQPTYLMNFGSTTLDGVTIDGGPKTQEPFDPSTSPGQAKLRVIGQEDC